MAIMFASFLARNKISLALFFMLSQDSTLLLGAEKMVDKGVAVKEKMETEGQMKKESGMMKEQDTMRKESGMMKENMQ